MEQPPGFVEHTKPNHVCQLQKALYGLKQAPRAWFDRFSMFLLSSGFVCSTADSSLFVSQRKEGILLLLVYVDDIILIGSNPHLISQFIKVLGCEFSMKDLGYIHYFLGVEVAKILSRTYSKSKETCC